MPAAPEVGRVRGEVGRREVLHQREAEQARDAARHLRVAPEIAVELEGEGVDAPQQRPGRGLPRCREDGIGDGREQVGGTLQQPAHGEERHAVLHVAHAQVARRSDRAEQALRTFDRPRHQLREEAHVGGELGEGAPRRKVPAVHLDRVGHGLEGVEGDADREQHVEEREGGGDTQRRGQTVAALREEVPVLEEAEQAQVRRAAEADPASARAPVFRGLEASRDPVVHRRREEEQRHVAPLPPGVEEVGGHEQQRVLRREAAAQQQRERQHRGQEEREIERVEEQLRLRRFGAASLPVSPPLAPRGRLTFPSVGDHFRTRAASVQTPARERKMRNRSTWKRLLLAGSAAMAFAAPANADGTFEVFSYNVQGLPPIAAASIPDRTTEISQIGPILEARRQAVGNQIVGLQEVFHQPYYDAITGAVNYSTETAKTTDNGPFGNFMTGDGLTVLTHYTPVSMTFHNEWGTCNGDFDQGNDCLTPKGYQFTRYELEPGATVDVYNVHMDAGQTTADRNARNAQFTELESAINLISNNRAVIVLGDTNAKFTRVNDVVDSFVSNLGLTDAWAEVSNGGVIPGVGADIDAGCPPPRGSAVGMAVDASGPTCELIDKVMFRSGGLVNLSALSYEVLLDFVDMGGVELADHLPVTTVLQYEVVPEPGTAALLLSGLFGLAAGGRRRA